MKDSILNLLNKIVALPGQAVDVVASALSSPDTAIKYTVAGVALWDLYSGAPLIGGLLAKAGGNIGALAVLVLAYVVLKK